MPRGNEMIHRGHDQVLFHGQELVKAILEGPVDAPAGILGGHPRRCRGEKGENGTMENL